MAADAAAVLEAQAFYPPDERPFSVIDPTAGPTVDGRRGDAYADGGRVGVPWGRGVYWERRVVGF